MFSEDEIMNQIKTKALCIFRYKEKVLLSKGYDPNKNENYLRPIGGGIEYGELSERAVCREVMEEIDKQIIYPKLLGVLENLFTFDGQQGHEVVFIYCADFVDESMYQIQQITGHERNGSTYLAQWFSKEEIEDNHYAVYPKGVEQWLFTT
jgi:ADP-ribose pyrophosphatase YjhB (NUDIX family)